MTGEPSNLVPLRPADPGEGLTAELRRELNEFRAQGDRDALSNPIQLLALTLRHRLAAGELTINDLEPAIQRLTVESFNRRAARLRTYLGEVDRAANLAGLRTIIETLVDDPDRRAAVAFETFQERVERACFGIVITAHPTFSLAERLRQSLMAVALDQDPGLNSAQMEQVGAMLHGPDHPLDLGEEHRQSVAAIKNVHIALADVQRTVLAVGRDRYPERWTELRPDLVSVASWVGYDLDGRADIPWTKTFATRLRMQIGQLERYREHVRALREPTPAASPVADILDLLDARLALAIRQAEDEAEVFDGAEGIDSAAWRQSLAAIARTMYAGRDARLTDAEPLARLVDRAIGLADDPDTTSGLCALAAEIDAFGLSLADSHVRLNARQLHNAIRQSIGMDHTPQDPSHRLTYLNAVADLIDTVEPVRINFGSLLGEKATAKRIFMVIAQMVKYLDRNQRVRFLIAECETGFTLVTALYYARLFGVEDRVEISPLFETSTGLDEGARVVAEALGVASYRRYVERQGRLCIQTGFSDAGRYLGQIAAADAIEKLRLALAAELAACGLSGIEVVVFDTHGESIGRGGHPSSFAERLLYIDSPRSRAAFADAGIRHKEETSFQGGDGYLLFATPESALAVVTRIVEHVLVPRSDDPDPFYQESHYTAEFFALIRRFHDELMDDPCYGALLGCYGANMLPRTGSRPLKRQHDSWSGQVSLEHPRQLRAIPHNAILQQLGFLANVIGGLGAAVAKDPERFQRLYEESARFRRLMTMVEHAFKFSDLDVLRAYIDLFDPGFWLARAVHRSDSAHAEVLLDVAAITDRAGLHEELTRVWRTFTRDYMTLADALREHRRRTRNAGAEPIAVDAVARDTMHQLHAIRLALIEELYLLATQVPDFSDRHDLTRDAVLAHLVRLDVDSTLAKLAEIFPIAETEDEGLDFGEPVTYESAGNQSYAQQHAQLFQPMAVIHRLIQRISAAIIHNIGALG